MRILAFALLVFASRARESAPGENVCIRVLFLYLCCPSRSISRSDVNSPAEQLLPLTGDGVSRKRASLSLFSLSSFPFLFSVSAFRFPPSHLSGYLCILIFNLFLNERRLDFSQARWSHWRDRKFYGEKKLSFDARTSRQSVDRMNIKRNKENIPSFSDK